ncbi:hypothetical protein LCGC14_1068760 [marine sediment metagenome]|uniref:Glycosyltransferase RgtA/B/C/D-like domain-containing protein n=1 Tax=marine sediment metagenome TaxID=412755 RepID=A0A0F9MNU4_9ZZZZ|nr:phospholipid carrier-dependent glycosyltransferase [Candidatus Aminicenantes bacterium]
MKVNLRLLFNFDKIVKIIQRNWYIGASIAILLFSFWLRWSGVDWQLPDTTYGDEEAIIQMTHSIPFRGDLVIRGDKLGFWYCPAYNYLTGIVFNTFDFVVVGVGLFPSHDLIPVWTHYIVGRTISILFSVGTIFVLLFMFKNVFGKFTALLAGLFLALNGIDLHVSTMAKSDTMAMFLGTLTLYLAFKIMTTKGWSLYIVAGVVYGVAVASKLFTLGFFVPLIVAHLLAQTGDNLFSRLRNAVKDWRWIIFPIAALGGYAISNPQVITAAGTFLKEVPAKLIFGYMSESNREFKTVSELLHQMKRIYSNILAPTYSSSLLALALTFIGSVVLLIRQFKLGLMMLVTFISVNLFILPATAAYGTPYHYLVIVPICALLIGSAIDALWSSAIRIRLPLFRFLLCGIITIAMVLAVPGMLDKAIRVPNAKTGEGILSRRTDFRKWMIDHIPPGSRIAYDRYGTDLLPGYFDVVKKPGYDKRLDYYSKNFDYVLVSWDRIDDYKVYPELIKRQPMATFEAEGVKYMPRLAIYKMDRDESNQARMRNFYTETLPRKMEIESTFCDPSFENGDLLESWGVRLFHPYRAWKHIEWWKWEEIYKPHGKAIKWWNGKNNPPHSLIERASDIWSDGKFSLHIMLAEEKPNEKVNLLSEGDSTFETEGQWIWHGSHSASREADGNSYEGKYALKVVSNGLSHEWSCVSLTNECYNYNSGQPNKLTFYAKSVLGSKTLRVRSGDGTWSTLTLSNEYRRCEIVGSTKEEDNILLILEGAGVFYLDSVEFGPLPEDKRIQIGQVIPYDLLDGLQYFSIDYYLQCDPAQDKPQGSIKLHFIAESIGGQYLNIETYVLYDSSKGQNPTYNKWHTFNRNIKEDFNKPFVRWKDIEFMIFFVEVENSEFGSLDIYVDNIQTAETLVLRKFLNDPDRNR